jgi:hypothetical protein
MSGETHWLASQVVIFSFGNPPEIHEPAEGIEDGTA